MKRLRCRFGVIGFFMLLLALGSVNPLPGCLSIESSFTGALLDRAAPSDVNETLVIPPFSRDVCWGWKGNLSFVYWDVAMNTGIENATVICQGWYSKLDAIDYDNGTYSIELDTTQAYFESNYYTTIILVMTFEKENYETQVVTYYFRIHKAPTEGLIQVPETNILAVNIDHGTKVYDLIVPIGDSLDLRFFYNDTDASDGYVGGLPGASTSAILYGPTLVREASTLNDLGNGNYSYLFDTKQSWLFEATGGVPFPHELPYYLDVEIYLANRTKSEVHFRIYIIEIPTELEALNFEEEHSIGLYGGESFSVSVRYSDAWPGHGSVSIPNANITVENPAPETLEILNIEQDIEEQGVYHIEFKYIDLFLHPPVTLTINIEKFNYENQTLILQVEFLKLPDILPPPVPWWWRLAPLVIFAFAIYYDRRNWRQKADSASDFDDASNYPVSSPHTLEEHGYQDCSIRRLFFYIILFFFTIYIFLRPVY